MKRKLQLLRQRLNRRRTCLRISSGSNKLLNVQLLNQMNIVAESAIVWTKEICRKSHHRDEINKQLRQRVEEAQRRHAEEATWLRNELAIATQERHRARLMYETTRTQTSTPQPKVASPRDRMDEMKQHHQVLHGRDSAAQVARAELPLAPRKQSRYSFLFSRNNF